ncbi:Growth hormone secretagogue receptor type 1 [Trichoplax sp. H2]|uniref:G-protein coupled receptors family 1 profile domain-containing protein n=1 Tax=Trichoplax adhaerens TaxID=10228 RepID=B3RZQ1_TRIAD|nr:hypothetical protein TRIADDRAFT_57535 [Trichoplax adhaerens]EDV23880.1 hypothetical protein TRIADDRAFT_57535 [Trichoplax adhaerens]RDD44091.1 Growth hormone secretagogue receptor type 1 [Trichoplax sp. H2]|eukprot:XP_002113406.1 hypothetical protein TRIADDRAFT_57535 [Trichoplax adhaerens]
MASILTNESSTFMPTIANNRTRPAPAYVLDPYLIIMTSVGISIIIVNTAFLMIILLYRQLRTTPNVIMCSMSVSSILFALIYLIPRYFPASVDLICKLLPFIGLSLALIINLHQCVISCHRYMAVANPLTHRRHMTKRHIAIILVLVWLLPFISSSIPAIFYQPLNEGFCRVFGYDATPKLIFYSSMYTIFFYLPLSIILFGYIYIHITALILPKDRKLLKRGCWKYRIHRHRRVLIHTAIIIELHALCWVPFITVTIAWYGGFTIPNFRVLAEVLRNIALSYPVINPLVYAYCTSGIRRRILNLIGYESAKRPSTLRSTGLESSLASGVMG